ncbi:hypothetical protein J5N97_008887 [Dioscorea zingiberensis]|uniref:RING-type E3 ubiquitin transferase n=1 Tax=Dioscorea zingiberensis TaxID=325984 RepID=A0A9D5CX69_9LILI|nr:hypothetical protein J5N97_008887 [Dioscorea zingiberensis]
MYKRKSKDSMFTHLAKHRSKPKNDMDPSHGPGFQIQQQQQQQRNTLGGRIMLSAIAAFFAAIIIVLFFHIYIRYHLLRRARRRRIARLLASSDLSLNPNPSATRGLDPDLLRSLPIAVRSPSDAPTDCSVCLMEIQEGEKVRVLPKCHHEFHTECIDMWFFSHATCPLCRAAVEAETPTRCNTCAGSSSGEAMIGIEEPPVRIDELGLGPRSTRWSAMAVKRFLISDRGLYSGTVADADLERGEGAEQDPHPVPSQSTVQIE